MIRAALAGIANALLVALLIGAVVVGVLWYGGYLTLASAGKLPATSAIHPDPRVNWQSYPVGGYKLLRTPEVEEQTGPVMADSVVVLPENSWLWIPGAGDAGPPPREDS